MRLKLKQILIIFLISTVVNFAIFYLMETDRDCVFDWGTKCSNSFFIRLSVQVVVLTLVLSYLRRTKKVDKQ